MKRIGYANSYAFVSGLAVVIGGAYFLSEITLASRASIGVMMQLPRLATPLGASQVNRVQTTTKRTALRLAHRSRASRAPDAQFPALAATTLGESASLQSCVPGHSRIAR